MAHQQGGEEGSFIIGSSVEGEKKFWLANSGIGILGRALQKDNVSLSLGALQGMYWINVFWKACKYSTAWLSLLPWNDNEAWKKYNSIFRWQH